MNRIRRWMGRRGMWVGLLALVGAALTLQGCFRGNWHGRPDPARFEEHMNDVQEEIAEELELQPHQRPQFDALMAGYRDVARGMRNGWHGSAVAAQMALEQEPADIDAIGELLKERVRQRVSDETLNSLIDDTLAFYRTLNAEQQEDVRDRVLRKLRRHNS